MFVGMLRYQQCKVLVIYGEVCMHAAQADGKTGLQKARGPHARRHVTARAPARAPAPRPYSAAPYGPCAAARQPPAPPATAPPLPLRQPVPARRRDRAATREGAAVTDR